MSSPPDPADAHRAESERVRAAYHDVFTGPSGKIVLHHLLTRAGMLEISHTAGDPYETAFREGRRSLGRDVMQQLSWSAAELEMLAHARMTEALTATMEQG